SSVGQFLYTNACKHGADAINQEVGVIEVGKRADLVVLDNEEASLFCKEDSFILDAAIFACNQLPVKDVFVAGRQIIESGHHQQYQDIKVEYHKVLKSLTA
ncbi:MAG: amidohydrolase family protein, partial [Kangiellaceae bacterium]|nr:amidohydrolase family protein [Kangiellaceae bacterium]